MVAGVKGGTNFKIFHGIYFKFYLMRFKQKIILLKIAEHNFNTSVILYMNFNIITNILYIYQTLIVR